MESKTTSLGGLQPQGQASLLDLTGSDGGTLIIVGGSMESKGSTVDLAGELAFLNHAADLHLAASAAPLMLAVYDVVIDAPIVVPKLAQYFDRVAASVLRSIAHDMGLEILSAKVDKQALRITMRVRCIPWQKDLLKHRYAEAQITLVMEPAAITAAAQPADQTAEGASDETSVEDGSAAA